MEDIEKLKDLFNSKLKHVASVGEVEDVRVEFLGKKGYLTALLGAICKLSPEERRSYGATINTLKNYMIVEIERIHTKLEDQELSRKMLTEAIDISLPPRNYEFGKQHPINRVISDLKNIFSRMGFTYDTGPDIENEWNNFTALNIPKHHPARQMHDTFYMDCWDNDGNNLLLRTHTSPVQVRHMNSHKPPIKIISIGKVYRVEHDATHTPMFHQMEGLYIDKNVTMTHLKSYLELFLRLFFEVQDAPIRLRPNYFPFTEPSVEVDVRCDRSRKDEIKIGVGEDWLEILGCGMVNPKVLQNAGINPEEYQGFAFGCGVERLTMLKYNIPDLRACFEGDMRWIGHYGL